jgi:pyridoxal phosphate enzyme (YggS family)
MGLGCTWHMIGHLQTNKVRRLLPSMDVLHSVDRDSLVDALGAELARARRPALPVLVQVNVSGEATKGGFAPAALPQALARLRDTPGLRVAGLMTMAPPADDPEEVRPVFRRLRELRDEAVSDGYLGALELSMGMSSDFEVAAEEGATMVRVGSVLFPGPQPG